MVVLAVETVAFVVDTKVDDIVNGVVTGLDVLVVVVFGVVEVDAILE